MIACPVMQRKCVRESAELGSISIIINANIDNNSAETIYLSYFSLG